MHAFIALLSYVIVAALGFYLIERIFGEFSILIYAVAAFMGLLAFMKTVNATS